MEDPNTQLAGMGPEAGALGPSVYRALALTVLKPMLNFTSRKERDFFLVMTFFTPMPAPSSRQIFAGVFSMIFVK